LGGPGKRNDELFGIPLCAWQVHKCSCIPSIFFQDLRATESVLPTAYLEFFVSLFKSASSNSPGWVGIKKIYMYNGKKKKSKSKSKSKMNESISNSIQSAVLESYLVVCFSNERMYVIRATISSAFSDSYS